MRTHQGGRARAALEWTRSRVRKWATRPIVIPGWMLTGKYLGFIVLGAVVYLATAPEADWTLTDWLSLSWVVLVMTAGAVGAVGSTSEEREPIERWGCTVLAVLLIAYAIFPAEVIVTARHWDQAVLSVSFLLISGIPVVRAIYLLRRTGLPTSTGNVRVIAP